MHVHKPYCFCILQRFTYIILSALGICSYLYGNQAYSGDWNYPDDAPVLDITDFGADPTGEKDATSAIQAAIDSTREKQFRIFYVYIPRGTYKVSKTLVTDRYVTIVGQSRDHSIIKLADNAQGFANESKPRSVLKMGLSMNMSFEVYCNNFTIDLGKGNSGATGLDYVGHNAGAVRHITVKGDGNALRGSYKAEPGAGTLFLEDYAGIPVFTPGQRVYARQLNTEDLSEDQTKPLVDVNDAAVWILGQKTEGYKTIIKVRNGGIAAMYGACFYHTKTSTHVPLFECENSNIFTAHTGKRANGLILQWKRVTALKKRLKQAAAV